MNDEERIGWMLIATALFLALLVGSLIVAAASIE